MALGIGAAASLAGLPASAVEIAPSLDALARARGLRFGSALGAGGQSDEFGDPRYRSILLRECGILVAENEHKWPFLQRGPNDPHDFRRADAMVDFAEKHGLLFRGHTLLWHKPQWLPRWVNEHDFGSQPGKEAERLLVNHINSVCKHYGTRIGAWDVVNETVSEQTGKFRETVFTRHIGSEVIDLAFHTARAAAPHARLVYNDYMTWEPHSKTHRDGVLRHLEAWLKRGVPVEALGIQGHIGTENSDSSTGFATGREEDWRKFLDEVKGMGLKMLITEFDVHDKGLPADIDKRDRAIADYARAFLDVTLSYAEVEQVLVWGMADHYSWLQDRWPRPDGLPKRPTPYSKDFKAKALRQAIADAFRAAPGRGQRTEL